MLVYIGFATECTIKASLLCDICRLGFFSAIGSVLGKLGRAMISEAKSKGIDGNLKGDGMQNGGTIIVAAGELHSNEINCLMLRYRILTVSGATHNIYGLTTNNIIIIHVLKLHIYM